jgi:NarL family two-component system sensor histidine kinase LiaS
LFEKTKDLAVIEERNRLARDLHDSAKQKAFAALAQLGAARGTLQRNPDGVVNHLVEAENLVYEVIQELSFLIQEMYPVALQEKGLKKALQEYVYEWETRNDIQVELHFSGDHIFPLQTDQAIYRIIQEGLANIARHSHATKVELNMNFGDLQAEITLSDDGCGFEQSKKPSGVGLRSMRERTQKIHGTFELCTAINEGTCIRIIVPYSDNEPADEDEGRSIP